MLINSRLKSRIIPVTYDFVALSRREFERQLAPLLYSTDVQKLIIDDRPDEFWYAKVDGKIDMDRAYFLGTGTINFLVPDGIAHSVATKTFDNKDPKWTGSPLNLLAGTSDQETSATVDLNNWNAPSQHPNISVTPGQKFAYQIFITNDNTVDLTAGIDAFSGTTWKATYLGNVIKAGTSGYSSVTFTIPSGADNIVANAARLVTRVPSSKTTVYWQEEKLATGTVVSPWSPNPADPEYYTNTITVHNGGTYPVEPVITATMHADNGFLGFANSQGGVLQFGTQEIDGYTTDVSEKGLNGDFSAPISGTIYNQSATNNPNWGGDSSKPNKQTGSINYASDSYNGPHMEPAYASTGTYWNGPAAKIPIAATSQNTHNNNFTVSMMLHFETTVSELGRMELTLEAGGKVQYQMVVTDNNAVKDEIQVDCYVKDQQVGTLSLDRSKFTNDKFIQARLSRFGSSINFEVSPWNGKIGREMTVSLPPLTRPDMISENIEAFSVWFERNNTWGQALSLIHI